jgi:hypothetical protein
MMQQTALRLTEQDVPKKNINASKLVPVFDWDDKVIWVFVKQAGGGVLGPVEVAHSKIDSYAGKLSWPSQEMWYSGKIDPTSYSGPQDILPITWTPGEPFPKEVPAKAPSTWAVKMVFQPVAASPEEVEIAHKVLPKAASHDFEGSLPLTPGELEDTGKTDANGFPVWKDKTTGEKLSLLPGDKLAIWSAAEHKYHYVMKTESGWSIDFTLPFAAPEDLDVEKKAVPKEVLPKDFELPPGYVTTYASSQVVMAKTPKGTAVKWLDTTHSWVYMDTPWQAHNPGEEEIDKAAKVVAPEPKPVTVSTTPVAPQPPVPPQAPPQKVITTVAPVSKAPQDQPDLKLPVGFELPAEHTLTSSTPKAVFVKTPGGVAVKWVVKLRSWWYVDQPGKEYRPGEGGVGAVITPPVQSAPPPPVPSAPEVHAPPPAAKVEPPAPPEPKPAIIQPGAPKNPKGFEIIGPQNKHGLWPIQHTETYDDGNWFVHQDGTVYHFHPAAMDYSTCKYGPMGWIEDNSVPLVSGAYFQMKKFYGPNPKIPEGFVHFGYDVNGLLLIQKGSAPPVSLLPNGSRAWWLVKVQQYKLEDGSYLKLDDILAGNFGKAAKAVTVADIPEEPPHWLTYVGEVDANGLPLVNEYSDDPDDDDLLKRLTLLPDERVAKWTGAKYQPFKYVEVTHTIKPDKQSSLLTPDDVLEMMSTLGLTVKDGRYYKVLDSNKVYDPSFPAGFEPLNPTDGEVGLVPVRQVSTNKKFYMLPGDMVASDLDGDLKKFDVFGVTQDGLKPKSEYQGLGFGQIAMMTKGLDPNPPKYTSITSKTDKNGYLMVRTRPSDPDSSDELSLLPNGVVAKWEQSKKKYVVWEWDDEFKDFGPDVTRSYTLKQVLTLQAKKLPGMPKAVPAVKPSQSVMKAPDPTPAPDYAMQDTGSLDENGHTIQKHLLTGETYVLLPTSHPVLGIWVSQTKAYRMVDWDPVAKKYNLAWKDEKPIWYLPGDPDVFVGDVEKGGVKKAQKKPPSADLTPSDDLDPNGYKQSYHKKGGPASMDPLMGPFSHLPGGKLGKWVPDQHFYQRVSFNSTTGLYEPLVDPKTGNQEWVVPSGMMSTVGSVPLGVFFPGELPEALDKLDVPLHRDENNTSAVTLPNGLLLRVPITNPNAIELLTKSDKGFTTFGKPLTKKVLLGLLEALPLKDAQALHPLGKADPNQLPLFEPNNMPGMTLSLLPNGKYAFWISQDATYVRWSQDDYGKWVPTHPWEVFTLSQVKAVWADVSAVVVPAEEDESKLMLTYELDLNGIKRVRTPSDHYFSQLPSGTVLHWNPYESYYEVMTFSTEEGAWVVKTPLQTLYPVEAKLALSNDPSALEAVGTKDSNGFPKYQGKDSDDRFVKLPDGQFAEFENLSGKYIPVTWEGSFWKRYYDKAYTANQALTLGKTVPEAPEPVKSAPMTADPVKPPDFDKVTPPGPHEAEFDKNGLPVFMTGQGLKLSWLPNGTFATWAAAAKRYSVRELVNDTWLPTHPTVKYTLDEVLIMVETHGPFAPNGPKAMYKGKKGPIPFLGHHDDLGLPAYESHDADVDLHRLPDGTWVHWNDDTGKYEMVEQQDDGAWIFPTPMKFFTKKDVLDMTNQAVLSKAPPVQTQPQIVEPQSKPLSPDHPDILPDPNGPDPNGIKTYIHKDQQASKFATPVVWHPGKKAFYCLVGKSYVLAKWVKGAQKGDWNFYFNEELTPDEMKAATADSDAPPSGFVPPPGLPAGVAPLLGGAGGGTPLKDKHGLIYYTSEKVPGSQVLLLPNGEFVTEVEDEHTNITSYVVVKLNKYGYWQAVGLDLAMSGKEYTPDELKALVTGTAPASPPSPAGSTVSTIGVSGPGSAYLPYSGGPDENGFPRYVHTDADPDTDYPVTLLPNGEFARWLGLSKLYQVMRWDSIPPPSWEKLYKPSGANAVHTLAEVEAMVSGKPSTATAPDLGNLVPIDKTDKNGLKYYQDKNHPSFKLSQMPDGATFGHWVPKKQAYQKMALQDDGSWESATFPITFIPLSDVEAMKIAMGYIASATPPSTPLTLSTAPSVQGLSPNHPDIVNSGEVSNDFMLYYHKLNSDEKVVWAGGAFYYPTAKTYHKSEWSPKTNEWIFVGELPLLVGELKALDDKGGSVGTSAFDPLSSLMGLPPTLKALTENDPNGYPMVEVIAEPGKKLTRLPNGEMAKWAVSPQKYRKYEYDAAGDFWSSSDPAVWWTLDQVKAMDPSSSAPVSDDEPGEAPLDAFVDPNFKWSSVLGVPDIKDLAYVGDGAALGYAGLGKKDIFEDPTTKQRYIFKPAIPKGGSKTELFRARVQEAYAAFAVKIRPEHIPIKTVTYNGQVGTLQPELKVKTNTLKGVKPKDLTPQQRQDLTVEHLLDWTMSQHDTHSDNLIITEDGRLISVDKEQGFRYFMKKDHSDKLSVDYQPNDTVYTPYYNIFWKAFEKGEFDLDLNAMRNAMQKIEAISSEEYMKLVEPYAASILKTKEERDRFVEKALLRKLHVRKDFETFLTDRYRKRTGKTNKRFSFESGWAGEWTPGAVAPTTQTLSGPEYAALKSIKIRKFEHPTITTEDPTITTLKVPASHSIDELLKFLSDLGLEQVEVGGIKTTTTSSNHKVWVKTAQFEAAKIEVDVPPPSKGGTPFKPLYWPDLLDTPKMEANSSEWATIGKPGVKVGYLGKKLTSDGGMVEGQTVRVKKFQDEKGPYHLVHFKLREHQWSALAHSSKAHASEYTYYRADWDGATETFTEESATSIKVKAKSWTDGAVEANVITDRNHWSYMGSVYMKVRSNDVAGSVKAALDAVKKGFSKEVFRDPTPKELEVYKLSQLLWYFAPQIADALPAEPDRTVEDLKSKLAAVPGFDMGWIDKTEYQDTFEGVSSFVLPGLWKMMAQGKLKFVFNGISSLNAAVNICSGNGLMGIHERALSGIGPTSYSSGGGSPGQDIYSGSGDQILTRMVYFPAASSHGFSSHSFDGAYQAILHPSVLDRLDTYMHTSDNYGYCRPDHPSFHSAAPDGSYTWKSRSSVLKTSESIQNSYHTGNEIGFRKGVSSKKIIRLATQSETSNYSGHPGRKEFIDAMRSKGFEEVNGVPLEDFVVVVNNLQEAYDKYVKPLGI